MILPPAADPHLLGRPLAGLPLVFLDLETTGLAVGEGHRICEVALVREVAGAEVGRLDLLVNPGRPLDAGAAAVNGLGPELLDGAPPFGALADTVLAALAGGVLVAHNAPFDLAFLNAELALAGRPPLAQPTLDTLALARRLLRRPSYSLHALATELGASPPAHRALADVMTLRVVFAFLAGIMAEQGVLTLGDAMRLERGLLPGEAEIEPPPLVAQAIGEGRQLAIVYRSRSTPEATRRLIRPLAMTRESGGAIYLRAYCFLRMDVRAFALDKIEAMELV